MRFDPVFLIALADQDPDVRSRAINGLWEYEEPTLIGPLVHLLKTDEAAFQTLHDWITAGTPWEDGMPLELTSLRLNAGSDAEGAAGLKIDLSLLFGGDSGRSAVEQAAMERDEQLVAVGRDAVGLSVGIPKRQADKESGPQDELDKLMDQLDGIEL